VFSVLRIESLGYIAGPYDVDEGQWPVLPGESNVPDVCVVCNSNVSQGFNPENRENRFDSQELIGKITYLHQF
ncbi:MAG: hypothetical protein AAGA85_16240, partial [Bacteroidota bacterium]